VTLIFYTREKLTGQDKRRAAPVIRKWLGGLFDENVDWSQFFPKYESIFRKTRPVHPVVLYRCPRVRGETGTYNRWTSWSYDRYINFGIGPDCPRSRIQAQVYPDDIEVVLPAFGNRIYSEGMAEVILRPGQYLIEPAVTFDDFSRMPVLSPPNYPQELEE